MAHKTAAVLLLSQHIPHARHPARGRPHMPVTTDMFCSSLQPISRIT